MMRREKNTELRGRLDPQRVELPAVETDGILGGAQGAAALAQIAQQSVTDGLIYMGHTNNNFIGASHQFASVWDNGSNLVDHLQHEIVLEEDVRQRAEKALRAMLGLSGGWTPPTAEEQALEEAGVRSSGCGCA